MIQIPDGVYQAENSNYQHMIVINELSVIKSMLWGEQAARYKYSISYEYSTGKNKISLKVLEGIGDDEGLELWDYIEIYSNPKAFYLETDDAKFIHIGP